MTTARNDHTATLLRTGKVLITGGGVGLSFTSSAELYDPATQTFTATGSMTANRIDHTATMLPNGKVLIVGGTTSTLVSEIYDAAAGTFSTTGSLNTIRRLHSATTLSNGQVLIIGGLGPGPVFAQLSTAEIYDPVLGTFTYTAGSMSAPRNLSVLLPSGKVLVAGGPNNTSEIFDPAWGLFIPASNMSQSRAGMTPVVLSNGKALFAGGAGVSVGSEVYSPTN
jgi:hypothetical protein